MNGPLFGKKVWRQKPSVKIQIWVTFSTCDSVGHLWRFCLLTLLVLRLRSIRFPMKKFEKCLFASVTSPVTYPITLLTRQSSFQLHQNGIQKYECLIGPFRSRVWNSAIWSVETKRTDLNSAAINVFYWSIKCSTVKSFCWITLSSFRRAVTFVYLIAYGTNTFEKA